MFFGWLWMLVPLLVIIAVVVAVLRGRDTAGGVDRHAAEQALARRFADGEIDEQEYRERSAAIGEMRSRDPSRQWWPLAIAIGVIVLLVTGLLWGGMGWGGMGSGWMWGASGSHMGWARTQATGTAVQPYASAPKVEITAGDLWFEPTEADIEAGQPTNLALRNTGQVFHDLTVPELDVMLDADAGDSVTAGVRVDEPGTYEFLCTVPGHADAGMRGTLTVS